MYWDDQLIDSLAKKIEEGVRGKFILEKSSEELFRDVVLKKVYCTDVCQSEIGLTIGLSDATMSRLTRSNVRWFDYNTAYRLTLFAADTFDDAVTLMALANRPLLKSADEKRIRDFTILKGIYDSGITDWESRFDLLYYLDVNKK